MSPTSCQTAPPRTRGTEPRIVPYSNRFWCEFKGLPGPIDSIRTSAAAQIKWVCRSSKPGMITERLNPYGNTRWQSAIKLPGTTPNANAASAFRLSTVRIKAEPPIFVLSVGSSKYMSLMMRR
jgi:hypothetical protein